MGDRLIHQELEKQAYWRPTKVAKIFEGKRYSYAEFNQRVTNAAAAFHKAGVEKGDSVFVHGLDHVDFYTVFYACSKIGSVFCPASKYHSLQNLSYIVDTLAPTVVLYTGDLPITDERLPTIRNAAPGATYLSLDKGEDDEWFESFIVTDGNTSSQWDENHSPERIHNILWTSGTTGRPKAVLRDHRSSLHFADNLINDLPFAESNIRITTNPMMLVDPYFHYGLPTVMAGGTVIVPRQFSPDTLYELYETYEANSLHLGFTLASSMIEYVQSNEYAMELDYLSAVIPSAGLAESLFQLTNELYHLYGTTEIGLPLVHRLTPPFEDKPSLGKPGIGADIRITPVEKDPHVPTEDSVTSGQTGQLACRGETTMTRYMDPEVQTESVKEGWIFPGDVVRINDDANIVFVGRADDRIRSGGVNVYPSEVENVLEEHRHVANSIVVGVDDEKWGQRVAALIVTSSDAFNESQLIHKLDSLCKNSPKLAQEIRPKEYAFVSSNSEIPSGAQEKEDRDAIVKQFFAK